MKYLALKNLVHLPLGVCQALEKTYCPEGMNKRAMNFQFDLKIFWDYILLLLLMQVVLKIRAF